MSWTVATDRDLDDLDVAVRLGDYFYEYGNEGASPGPEMGRTMIPDHDCKTIDDYRTRYAQMRLDDDCRRLHERYPTVHVFDDHECADDRWWGGDRVRNAVFLSGDVHTAWADHLMEDPTDRIEPLGSRSRPTVSR